jgi:thioredoxin reductase (NADPH)
MNERASHRSRGDEVVDGSIVDCAVVGAGPAGISAAQWLYSLSVDFRWFGRDAEFGGMLRRVHNPIKNYPGGIYPNGAALIESFREALESCGGLRPEAGRVASIAQPVDARSTWEIAFDDQDDQPTLRSRTVILATGTTYRRLEVPGESEGLGRYVSQSATADGARFREESVAVVGGGDAAFEGALILAETAKSVAILMRGERCRARRFFRDRVHAAPNIFVHPTPTRVERIEQTPTGCRLHLDSRGRKDNLDVACLFVRIGVEPALPPIATDAESALALRDGFVLVDDSQATNLDGIFAAGDITHCTLRAVATAVGTGAVAARAAAARLESRRR